MACGVGLERHREAGRQAAPDKGLELIASSVSSSFALASGSSSGLVLGMDFQSGFHCGLS